VARECPSRTSNWEIPAQQAPPSPRRQATRNSDPSHQLIKSDLLKKVVTVIRVAPDRDCERHQHGPSRGGSPHGWAQNPWGDSRVRAAKIVSSKFHLVKLSVRGNRIFKLPVTLGRTAPQSRLLCDKTAAQQNHLYSWPGPAEGTFQGLGKRTDNRGSALLSEH